MGSVPKNLSSSLIHKFNLWGFPDSSDVRIRLQCRRPWFDPWVGKICWRMDRLPTPVFLGFPWGSAGKESACNEGDLGSIPGLGRSAEEWKGYPLQYSCLENSMDCIIHGVIKSRTWLSDFHFNSPWYLYLKITDERCGSVTGYGGCWSNL